MAPILPKTRPKTRRGRERREQLLRSAEEVFGQRGFAAASIADITRNADTALGTFYLYFAGKEAVFRDLVLEMGRLTRARVAGAIAGAHGRLEAERRGLEAFLRFVAERPSLYTIVEEARIVDPEAYRAYYSDFAEAYRSHLQEAQDRGEISPGDAEIRAWALMGMAKTLGERYALWRDEGADGAPHDLSRVADEGFALIRHGLAP